MLLSSEIGHDDAGYIEPDVLGFDKEDVGPEKTKELSGLCVVH
jgi:hypothetical protein